MAVDKTVSSLAPIVFSRGSSEAHYKKGKAGKPVGTPRDVETGVPQRLASPMSDESGRYIV
jgi:hypothetical protein